MLESYDCGDDHAAAYGRYDWGKKVARDGRGTRKQVRRYAGTLARRVFPRRANTKSFNSNRSRGDEEQAREMDGSGLSARPTACFH